MRVEARTLHFFEWGISEGLKAPSPSDDFERQPQTFRLRSRARPALKVTAGDGGREWSPWAQNRDLGHPQMDWEFYFSL